MHLSYCLLNSIEFPLEKRMNVFTLLRSSCSLQEVWKMLVKIYWSTLTIPIWKYLVKWQKNHQFYLLLQYPVFMLKNRLLQRLTLLFLLLNRIYLRLFFRLGITFGSSWNSPKRFFHLILWHKFIMILWWISNHITKH